MPKGRITRLNKDLEPQEILLDALSAKREVEMGRFEVPLSQMILKIIFGIFLLLSFFLIARAYQYQVVDYAKYNQLSSRNQFIRKYLNSNRGIIYDRNYKQIVLNTVTFDIVCDKPKFNDEKLEKIALLIKKDKEELKKNLKDANNEITVYKNLSQDDLVLAYAQIADVPDCQVAKREVRQYQDAMDFAHIIGYKKDEGTGMGLEYEYDEFLKTTPVQIRQERDAHGKILSEERIEAPEPGKNLVLNIDYDLQKKIYQIMSQKISEIGAPSGAGIAIDPRDGSVLAMVAIPGFDNNLFSKGMKQEEWEKLITDRRNPLMNRAIAGYYPAASTIKPFIAYAALKEGIVNEHSVLDCPQELCLVNPYSGKKLCFVDWKYHGSADLNKAIAESVNPYFYKVTGGWDKFKGMGIDKLTKYLDLFNFGKETGIDIKGEKAGNLPTPEWKEKKYDQKWSVGDTYNLSIGHGFIQTTPIQIANAYVPLANGGTMYKPHIVQKIVDQDKNVIKEIQPEIVKKDFLDPVVLEKVRKAMIETVNSPAGTAHVLSNLPVQAAGKTGTGETSRDGRYDIWISIFAPYENPEIVLVLIAQEVPSGRFFVGPASYEILNWYFTRNNTSTSDISSSTVTTTQTSSPDIPAPSYEAPISPEDQIPGLFNNQEQ